VIATTVDSDAFGRLLLDVEARIHQSGWDEPPQLHIVYDSNMVATDEWYRNLMGEKWGPMGRLDNGYRSRSMVSSAMFNGDIVAHLLGFADTLAHYDDDPLIRALRDMLRRPGLLGFAFVAEAWMQTGTGGRAEYEKLTDGGRRRLADIPESKEIRTVMAMDTTGCSYVVNRIRGQKPELTVIPEDAELEGRVPEALGFLMKAMV
jgi:hypothetical protein